MNVAELLFNPLAFGESEGKRGRLRGKIWTSRSPNPPPPCRSHLSHDATVPRCHTFSWAHLASEPRHRQLTHKHSALRSMHVHSADTSGTLSGVHLSIRPEWRCAKGQISANTCQEGLDTSDFSFFFFNLRKMSANLMDGPRVTLDKVLPSKLLSST